MSQATYVYQTNAYFGVHYPAEYIDHVLGVLADTEFKGLATDKAECRVGKQHLFASTNSDVPNEASKGFIFVDEMTFGGPDYDDPEDTHVDLVPSEMEKREAKYPEAVSAIEKIYLLIVADFKKRKVPIDQLYNGWRAIACVWELDDESDESVDESVPQPAPAQPAPIQPAPAKKSEKDVKGGKKVLKVPSPIPVPGGEQAAPPKKGGKK